MLTPTALLKTCKLNKIVSNQTRRGHEDRVLSAAGHRLGICCHLADVFSTTSILRVALDIHLEKLSHFMLWKDRWNGSSRHSTVFPVDSSWHRFFVISYSIKREISAWTTSISPQIFLIVAPLRLMQKLVVLQQLQGWFTQCSSFGKSSIIEGEGKYLQRQMHHFTSANR